MEARPTPISRVRDLQNRIMTYSYPLLVIYIDTMTRSTPDDAQNLFPTTSLPPTLYFISHRHRHLQISNLKFIRGKVERTGKSFGRMFKTKV